MTFRNRAKPRTQEQADSWAIELDRFNNGLSSRIKNRRQAFILAEELDIWIMQ